MRFLKIIPALLLSIIFFSNHVVAASAKISGCELFPANNTWNTPIDKLPVDPRSDIYIDTIGRNTHFHPDFGAGQYNGGPIGIPFDIVSNQQAGVSVTFDYADESDVGPYPVPANPSIEGGINGTGDRHILILEKDSCTLYELFNAHQRSGGWHAGSGAIFDLASNRLRPNGWTSADAAGLPILPGLIRFEEVAAGEIRHPIRFTIPQTRKAYVWPARHFASSLTDSRYPPLGQYFRLKSSFNINNFPSDIKVILKAMKKYGIILADNGSPWFISGAPDERWDNDQLRALKQLTGDDFEAVITDSLMVNIDSGQVQDQGVSTPPPDKPSAGVILPWFLLLD